MSKKIFTECERCGEKVYVGDIVYEYLEEFYCSTNCIHVSVENTIDSYQAEVDEGCYEEKRI